MATAPNPSGQQAYRRTLAQLGQPVTIIRNVGVAPNVTQISATVQAIVKGYQPDGASVGRTQFSESRMGAITQGDRHILLLVDDLARADFPVPVVKNDKALVQGELLNITAVDPNTRYAVGAIDLVATGV
jgi:hypothetical protein